PAERSGYVILTRVMSKRRTWVCVFVSVYAVLLSLSWNLLKSVLYWCETEPSVSPDRSGWSALYASLLLGAAFGILSVVAALSVAVPATLVTWITVLVLMAFCGKPRKALVADGRKLTADITGFAARILIREGKAVAAVCAVVGYLAL
ncbi:hypothetical protein M569_09316, partial [Genlisea aurea]